MKIAILMSVYNGEKYLDKQLESIKNQTLVDNIKIYIRDDGSTDLTHEIIKKWMKDLDIEFIKGKNKGPALSFWDLFKNKKITADYYAFCDQDDIWDQDKIEVGINALTNNSLYCCNCRIIDENDTVIEEYRKKKIPRINIPEIFVSGITQGCSMIITNDLRNRILEKNINVIPMHDLVVFLYSLQIGNIIWDEDPHFSYRFHSSNVIAKKKKFDIHIIKKIKKWKASKEETYSLKYLAREYLNNFSNDLEYSEKEFLMLLSNYDKSLINKFKLLEFRKILINNRPAIKSFYFRVLFNLI